MSTDATIAYVRINKNKIANVVTSGIKYTGDSKWIILKDVSVFSGISIECEGGGRIDMANAPRLTRNDCQHKLSG